MPDDGADALLETYEDEIYVCTSCGETYEPNETDRGLCATCEDFDDICF